MQVSIVTSVFLACLSIFGLFLSACTGVAEETDESTLPWLRDSYFPAWAERTPSTVLTFKHNDAQTDEENGSALAQTIQALKPGEMLKIAPGRYSIDRWFVIDLQGQEQAPIWIVAEDLDNKPVLTRPDRKQNVINIGTQERTEYLCLRGLEIRGGDDLIKLYDCASLWIDQCYLHDGNGVGIAANSADTSFLYITRNEIARPGGPGDTGEGMYLGSNHSAHRMSYSVIALNHVHHTDLSKQGDGIEVKQGSYNNWVAENYVHDTNYPCILVYGTDALGINLVERNTVHGCKDNTMQIQGEAIVRNNLIMDGGVAFASSDHQGKTRDLAVVHNTIINSRRATNLHSWNGRDGMVFANNVVYSRTGEAIRFPRGASGVTISGNAVFGGVSSNVQTDSEWVKGAGLTDFQDVTWDAAKRDATPSANSPFIGKADTDYLVPTDITGMKRKQPPTPGAFELP